MTPAQTPPKRRVLFTDDARFAATPAENGKPARLSGYPIVWGATSTDRGGYRVRLLKGSPQFHTPTDAYFEHDFRLILGSTGNQTLSITPDDIGVRVEMTLPDTQNGRDAFTLVRDKYIRGMSFAMVEAPWAIQGWTAAGPQIVPVPGSARVVTENGETIVEVTKGFVVDEVTVTGRPAFVETTIGVAPPPSQDYSARHRHANRLAKFKFESLSPAGPGLARSGK